MYIAGTNRTVDTGDTYFNEISQINVAGRVKAESSLNRGRISKLKISDAIALKARIEHARYIVDCPNCNGAEFAFEDNLFFCSLCKNSDIGGKARRVIMPKERKQIETVLAVRPIKNRHWYPGETLAVLQKENVANLGVI